MNEDLTTQSFPDNLASLIEPMDLPGYFADLARLECILHKKSAVDDPNRRIQTVTVNPTLTMVSVRWKNLTAFIRSNATGPAPLNEPAHEIVWRHPESGDLHYREARDIDLLALKLIVEQIDPKEAARITSPGPWPFWRGSRTTSSTLFVRKKTRRCSADAPATAAARYSTSWRCCPTARCTPAGSFPRWSGTLPNTGFTTFITANWPNAIVLAARPAAAAT